MSFKKIGSIFKIANTQVLNTVEQWNDFKKIAGLETAIVEVKDEEKKESKTVDNFKVVAEVDPEKFVYIHTTIMAGITTEDNGFWITPETEKYINDNNDSWTCDDLKQDYPTFRKAITFVEHDQNIERAKGKCIDAIARKLPDTILIDVLFSVDKRHVDLVNNILSGIINAVSMGCSTEKTICSICGNEATDSKNYCTHIRNGKGKLFKCSDGKMRKAAEICKGNTFIDVSLVANPAFAGAVFRNILSSNQLSNQLLANIISNKIENFNINDNLFSKAASTNIENQEKTSSSILSRIVNKLFKSADHPIENDVSDKDFSINDEDFKSVEQIDNEQRNKAVEERNNLINVSRLSQTVCPNCESVDELWQMKAAAIDSDGTIKCKKCSFIIESSIINKFTKKVNAGITYHDKQVLTDLGFKSNDWNKLSQDQLENIMMFEITKREFDMDPNIAIRKSHTLDKIIVKASKVKINKVSSNQKSSLFVVSNDIPVNNTNNVLAFSNEGDEIIKKGEVLEFVSSNNEFEIYKTALNEKVIFPLKKK